MPNEVIYHASRLKALLMLATAIAFIAIGYWISKDKPVLGWLCVVFFSFGVPVSLATLLPSVMYLRLDADGFETASFGRKQRTRWQDVKSFRLASIRGAKMIAVQYRPEVLEHKSLRAVASAMAGMDGAIPNRYDVSLKELERTLNEWHARFGQPQAT